MPFNGNRLVYLRKKLGLTQKDFGAQIGYSRTYLSDIEVEKVEPSKKFVEAVIDSFGVTYDYLFLTELEEWMNRTSSGGIYAEDSNFFIFLYSFNDDELKVGESELEDYLSSDFGVVPGTNTDVTDCKNMKEIISKITGIIAFDKAPLRQFADFLDDGVVDGLLYICIRNLSKSKIPNKEHVLLKLIKASESCVVVVLDKASFLEKLPRELYTQAEIKHVGYDPWLHYGL